MRFSYQKILEIKERLREEKERELQLFFELDRKIEVKLEEVEREIIENQKYLLGIIEGNDFSVLMNYLSFLDDRKENLKKEKRDVEKKIEQLKAELTELLMEIKMLENIKSKRLKAYKREEEKRIQKRIDEFSVRKKKSFPQ